MQKDRKEAGIRSYYMWHSQNAFNRKTKKWKQTSRRYPLILRSALFRITVSLSWNFSSKPSKHMHVHMLAFNDNFPSEPGLAGYSSSTYS